MQVEVEDEAEDGDPLSLTFSSSPLLTVDLSLGLQFLC
jgi:hypothetical protein